MKVEIVVKEKEERLTVKKKIDVETFDKLVTFLDSIGLNLQTEKELDLDYFDLKEFFALRFMKPGGRVERKTLWAAYSKWRHLNGFLPVKKSSFFKAVEKYLGPPRIIEGVYYFGGYEIVPRRE